MFQATVFSVFHRFRADQPPSIETVFTFNECECIAVQHYCQTTPVRQSISCISFSRTTVDSCSDCGGDIFCLYLKWRETSSPINIAFFYFYFNCTYSVFCDFLVCKFCTLAVKVAGNEWSQKNEIFLYSLLRLVKWRIHCVRNRWITYSR